MIRVWAPVVVALLVGCGGEQESVPYGGGACCPIDPPTCECFRIGGWVPTRDLSACPGVCDMAPPYETRIDSHGCEVVGGPNSCLFEFDAWTDHYGGDDADVVDADGGPETDDDAPDAELDADAATCLDGWYDPTSGLCWEELPEEADRAWLGATIYCIVSVLGGHDDWRLPTIDELRSLVRGCSDTMTGGACLLTDTCPGFGCFVSDDCLGCPLVGGGPGSGGAYWPEGLGGIVGPYWSSTACSPDCSGRWMVNFANGAVLLADDTATANVRCVRPGP